MAEKHFTGDFCTPEEHEKNLALIATCRALLKEIARKDVDPFLQGP